MDIPESVVSASGAGALCGHLLATRRGKLSQGAGLSAENATPPKKSRKVGVFVCHCGANIGRVVDVPAVVEYASKLNNVVHAEESLFACATNNAKPIADTIRDKGSTASSSPPARRARTSRCSATRCAKAASISISSTWPISANTAPGSTPRRRTTPPQRPRTSCACRWPAPALLQPLEEIELPVNKAALVVGGGVAGMTSALSMAEQGFEIYLVEKDTDLGGMARRIHYTLEGLDVQAYLNDLMQKVYRHPVDPRRPPMRRSLEVAGYVGNFTTKVKIARPDQRDQATAPRHRHRRRRIQADRIPVRARRAGDDPARTGRANRQERRAVMNAQSVVMIQCVGCRKEDRNYCSRVCCSQAIKNALKLKQTNPAIDIYILFRDMRTYGFKEDYYREAASKDVKFIRYEPEDKPVVEAVEEEGRQGSEGHRHRSHPGPAACAWTPTCWRWPPRSFPPPPARTLRDCSRCR